MSWCLGSQARLLIGNTNDDDRRADMVCHNTTGETWIARANLSGGFDGTSWFRAAPNCSGDDLLR